MKDITQLPKKFYITYFAKKHKKIITRQASGEKPNGVLGKMFTDKNGTDRFIYWDLTQKIKLVALATGDMLLVNGPLKQFKIL